MGGDVASHGRVTEQPSQFPSVMDFFQRRGPAGWVRYWARPCLADRRTLHERESAERKVFAKCFERTD